MARRNYIFQASDGLSGTELWVTDGTPAGTWMVKDINPGIDGSNPRSFAVLPDGRALFQATTNSAGIQLWITDGTEAGTIPISASYYGGGPYELTRLGNGKVLFGAADSPGNTEIWITDGTVSGTSLLKEINPGTTGSYPRNFTALPDGRVVFGAGQQAPFYGDLWITDGTTAGTMFLKDTSPAGGNGPAPSNFTTQSDSTLTFVAGTGRFIPGPYGGNVPEYAQWSTDGTAAGTVMINGTDTSLPPGLPAGFFTTPLYITTLADGRFVFTAESSGRGREPWVSDGTVAGTLLLKDIQPGEGASHASGFTPLADGRLVFAAFNDAFGTELWITDGTVAGTALLKDINPNLAGIGIGSGSGPASFVPLSDGRLMFSASDGTTGIELWTTDGTAIGTVLLKDINVGAGHSFPGGPFPGGLFSDEAFTEFTPAPNIVLTGLPALGGSVVKGASLSATAGTLTDADGIADLCFAWQRDDGQGGWQDIAAGAEYRPVSADVGHVVRIIATVTDRRGVTETVAGPVSAAVRDDATLVDDAFYLVRNPDVAAAGVDADVHYRASGWREGRDPNGFFSTDGYLSANADIRAANLDPLEHFRTFGWREGRDPSAVFDVEGYLARNPDVATAGIDPLEHFLSFGRAEGRAASAAVGRAPEAGFDAAYYLLANPDVGRAGADAAAHYRVFGWREGRDPNAFFDASDYLDRYPDVLAAGTDPLAHYLAHGWREGRRQGGFDAEAYLARNPDVADAEANPLEHFLMFGAREGRLATADELLG